MSGSRPAATVGEVNATLTRVGAEIVLDGPRLSGDDDRRTATDDHIEALAGTCPLTLEASSRNRVGARLAMTSSEDELPSASAANVDEQLLVARFPGAWNARNLVVDHGKGNCRQGRLPSGRGRVRRPAPSIFGLDSQCVTSHRRYRTSRRRRRTKAATTPTVIT